MSRGPHSGRLRTGRPPGVAVIGESASTDWAGIWSSVYWETPSREVDCQVSGVTLTSNGECYPGVTLTGRDSTASVRSLFHSNTSRSDGV